MKGLAGSKSNEETTVVVVHVIDRTDFDRVQGVGRGIEPNRLYRFTLNAVLFHTDVSNVTVERLASLAGSTLDILFTDYCYFHFFYLSLT